MKIIDARTGNLQTIPLELGERGRGRWCEEVKVSNRPGQTPSGPEDVGYFTFGQDRPHVILTKSDGRQRGILLRIDTRGAYTKGSCGSVALKAGAAKLLVSGQWAEGAAGNVAQGPDELWHVEGPAVFSVVLQGGSHKGYGRRWLIVTRSFRVVMIKGQDLAQKIASDDDPELVATAKGFASVMDEDIQAAVATAETLEAALNAPETAVNEVTHFHGEWGSIEGTVAQWGLAIPAAMQGKVRGVSGIQAGTLIPGTKPLVALTIGPNGGKRYCYKKVSEAGISRLQESCERPYTVEAVLALVESPDWHSAWIDYKDREPSAYCLANAGGVHRLYPGNNRVSTEAWAGLPTVSPSVEDMRKLFSITDEPQQAQSPRWSDRW